MEMLYISLMGTQSPGGYNLTAGGEGMNNPSVEVRFKLGAGFRGQRFSRLHHTRISKALLGKKKTPEHIANNKAAVVLAMTPEVRARASANNRMRGHNRTAEDVVKISLALRGKRHTVEHCNRISDALWARDEKWRLLFRS
jgi:hypothetical protein